ncbi:MAG: hypothetical protein RLZZ436_3198 [Planctomycetota bacterium]
MQTNVSIPLIIRQIVGLSGPAELVEVTADFAELAVGIFANKGHAADADDDDQGEHYRIFNGGRAIFGLQEITNACCELGHCLILLVVPNLGQ